MITKRLQRYNLFCKVLHLNKYIFLHELTIYNCVESTFFLTIM